MAQPARIGVLAGEDQPIVREGIQPRTDRPRSGGRRGRTGSTPLLRTWLTVTSQGSGDLAPWVGIRTCAMRGCNDVGNNAPSDLPYTGSALIDAAPGQPPGRAVERRRRSRRVIGVRQDCIGRLAWTVTPIGHVEPPAQQPRCQPAPGGRRGGAIARPPWWKREPSWTVSLIGPADDRPARRLGGPARGVRGDRVPPPGTTGAAWHLPLADHRRREC